MSKYLKLWPGDPDQWGLREATKNFNVKLNKQLGH